MRGAAALLLLALVLSGCQTTAQQSAQLESVAKREQREDARRAPRGLSIARQSTKVRISASTVLHSSEGNVVVLTLRNLTASALRDVPLEIDVEDAQGGSLYSNDTPGLAPALTSAALLPAHATVTWIDDQVQAAGTPASVSAKVGEGRPVTGAVPQLTVEDAHLAEEGGSSPGVEGTVLNRSAVTQRELVVDALARRNGRVVAAGRAVLAQVADHSAAHFQLYFIGPPLGAQLELSVHASTLG